MFHCNSFLLVCDEEEDEEDDDEDDDHRPRIECFSAISSDCL